METPPSQTSQSTYSRYLPVQTESGGLNHTRYEYTQLLAACKRKEPLLLSCTASGFRAPKSYSLEKLRCALIDHWYGLPSAEDAQSVLQTTSPGVEALQHSKNIITEDEGLITRTSTDTDRDILHEFDVYGANAEEILGFDDDEDDDEEDEVFNGVYPTGDSDDDSGTDTFTDFKRRTRVEETRRAEGNRRAGGIKTQKTVHKAWKEFVDSAIEKGDIKDEIIDEHHLLIWIKFCSERPKKTRKGIDIPGTFVGASHIKKLYFGVLRIRKEQEAEEPQLKHTRPATSVTVWDSLKTRMDEALHRVRSGLIPGEDAPDIVANTFLASVTEEQIDSIGKGFLMHSHLHSAINGHLAWSGQNASGNRGDDFRALKLCELQPYTFLHPNGETGIQSVLGLQGEEKAGAGRKMRTKINPVYSAFITHLHPERCPLGAFAFYHHYIHDVKHITETMDIDWSVNNSWRQIRVLHGQNSPTVPYNEQSLYNLYVKAFAKANFTSNIKAHLPRHMLGYRQEKLGVDSQATAKLGWVKGETYFDSYAPSLPKTAILGAHGYKKHETYDPVWRHVHVPEQFLDLVCPVAESIHSEIVGRENLSGAANYWSMVIFLRRYVFLCGAAIFQTCPESAIFRLPALANHDVQAWMKAEYPTGLALLRANEGSQIDLQRIQNESLRLALEEVRSLLTEQKIVLQMLTQKMERRTAVLSPTKTFSQDIYSKRFNTTLSPLQPALKLAPSAPPAQLQSNDQNPFLDQDVGVYAITESMSSHNDSGFRAYVNSSPKQSQLLLERERTQVDLVLPPALAFTNRNGPQLMWPPILGQHSITWDEVYPLIKRPEMLGDCWGPKSSLETYTLSDLWLAYNTGERVFDTNGVQTGVKPPLRQVEQYFKSTWRKTDKQRKAWQRFREIPEYVERASEERGVSPQFILDELEQWRTPETGSTLKTISSLANMIKTTRIDKSKSHPPPLLEEQTEDAMDITPASSKPKRKAPVDVRRHKKKLKNIV